MSTPRTATTTLPPCRPVDNYTYSNAGSYQPDSNTVAYRMNNPTTRSYYASSNTSTAALSTNGFHSPAFHDSHVYVERPVGPAAQPRSGLSYADYADMPPVQSHPPLERLPVHSYAPAPAPVPSVDSRPTRAKRKRDWNEFFGGRLPEEVIVIHDSSPEPEPKPQPSAKPAAESMSQSRILPLPVPSHPPSAHGIHVADYNSHTSAHHVAKKRRRDNEPTHYDPVYHNIYAGSHTPLNHHATTPGLSTISSDRTTSAVHTTAATSLESLSSTTSIAHDYYNNANTGEKRKRTTRQQVALETRRRQEEQGDACLSYRPLTGPPKRVADVPVKVIADVTYAKASDFDDEDGHYNVIPGQDLANRYKVIRLLGQGTFGKVVEADDATRPGRKVAIKVIRSVQKYRDASKIELRVLATLKANDPTNRNRCIHFNECFDYRGHICIVMDLLGQSLFDFLKGNSFVPFPNSQIQNFARQLFTSVAFLHDLQLIHTDLKPENILLCNSKYQTFTYSRPIPSSSSAVDRFANTRRVLLDTEIRLIDFGSATFESEYHSSVVSTRHYRAPEIILGLGWSFPCDIWSIGCILVEFFTGDALFQTHDNLEHLAMMEAVVGQRIDSHLVQQVNLMARRSNGGNPASKYFSRLKLAYPQNDTNKASRRFVRAMKRLEVIIPQHGEFYSLFLDLLRKIFIYDPSKRITAKQALQHPWFKLVCPEDDGTEAVKIRMENLKKERAEARAREAREYSEVQQRDCREGRRLAPIHIP